MVTARNFFVIDRKYLISIEFLITHYLIVNWA